MASERSSGQQQRAVSLLTEAVNILRSPAPAAAAVRSATPAAIPTISNRPSTDAVSPRSEIDRLFAPYRRDISVGKASGSGTKFSWPAPYPNRSWKPKDSWTHQFVCLADVGCSNIPNRQEKRILKDAGLGESKVVFSNKRGGHAHVNDTLESVFPKMKDAGGFEILRSSGSNRSLEIINVPATGYTVQQLKESLGQAIAYIRPLQKDLSLQSISKTDNEEEIDTTKSPTIECLICKQVIPLPLWHRHQAMCSEIQKDDETDGANSTSQGKLVEDNQTDGTNPTSQESQNEGMSSSINDFFDMDPINVDDETEMIQQLEGIFPNGNRDLIREAVDSSITIQDAVDYVLKNNSKEIDETTLTLEELLKQKIYKKVTGPVLKVRVDADDILSDAIAFYKRNDFDPSRPVRVYFNGQPAVDTGGVKRQFFSDLFEKLTASTELKLFEGPPTRLLFSYNQHALSSGIAKLFGTIVGHCVVQGCGGFPYLAESSYHYLVTGDITQAMDYVTIADVYDVDAVHFINQVVDCSAENLPSLRNDLEFLKILSECGVTSTVGESNRYAIAQSIVSHHVLGKRIPMIDQFSRGLDVLGLMEIVQTYPNQCKRLFVQTSDNAVTITSVKEATLLFTAKDDVEEKLKQLFERFLLESSLEGLKQYIKFCTGSTTVPQPPTHHIHVDVNDVRNGIFASTCLLRLHLPKAMGNMDFKTLKASLDAAFSSPGKALKFTSV